MFGILGKASATGGAPPTFTLLENDFGRSVGTTDGNFLVRATGTGFTGATALEIDGTPVTDFTVVSDTEITGTAADSGLQGSSTLVDAEVLHPNGNVTLVNAFRFFDPGAVSPSAWYREDRTTSGSDVTQWTDRTGNGFHLVPGVAPQTGGSINGKPTIDFNGTTQYLTDSLVSDVFDAASKLAYVMFNADDTSSNQPNTYDNTCIWGDAGAFVGQFIKTGNTIAFNWDGNDDNQSVAISASTSTFVEYRQEGGSIYVRKNNDAESAGAATGGTAGLGNAMQAGKGWTSNYYNGRLGELFYFQGTLPDATNREYIRDYMQTRWNIA